MFKACPKCGEVKSLDEFHRNKKRRDGKSYYCKICKAESKRRYCEKNREKVAESSRRYYEKNREKVAERNRRYREANPEKVAEYKRRYRDDNRETSAEQKRRYYAENRDYVLRDNSRRMSRIQSVTSSASNKCGRWSDVEIGILLADDGRSLASKALELGRTYSSCAGKLNRIRKAEVAV